MYQKSTAVQNINNVKNAAQKFLGFMKSGDRACVVTFSDRGNLVCSMKNASNAKEMAELSKSIDKLSPSGGTNTDAGLDVAINHLNSNSTSNKRIIILLCDGDVRDTTDEYIRCNKSTPSIQCFTVNVGGQRSNEPLEVLASKTGGKYYFAQNSTAIIDSFYKIQSDTLEDIDLTDMDNDGVPDTFEIVGMRLANGNIITSNPFVPCSDNDGWNDGQEIGKYKVKEVEEKMGDKTTKYYSFIFNPKADPRKEDTDGDGIIDNKDPYPLVPQLTLEKMYANRKIKSNSKNAVNIEIEDNTVIFNINIKCVNSMGLENTPEFRKYAGLVVSGIEKYWEADNLSGSIYDFEDGIENIKSEVRINDFTNVDVKNKQYIAVQLDLTTKEFNEIDAREPVCIPSYDDWMPSSSCGIQLFKKPLYKDVNTGEIDAYTLTDAEYEIVVAHEFGHAFGLADFVYVISENEIMQPKISIEIPEYSIMRLRASRLNDFVNNNTQVWANDLEMILEAFYTEDKMKYEGGYNGYLIDASVVVKFDKEPVILNK
ncbi:VWA domain-containing protein [Cellulosilyticum sp. ST5]|uniref:vWA domain-containing protein n=1 Tax=Cellulosilyticum sp. ST5 TaxID=3055805 RepID=UPI003977739B